jgi:glutamyl-tRNA synthetase
MHMSEARTGYRGRFAPSPTGAQHIGNARTHLIAWLAARSCGGRIGLRIEDIDSPRVKRGSIADIADGLRWLGLDWDEDLGLQSKRLAAYEAALEQLKKQELVYPCTCSRKDIEEAASAPHDDHEAPIYPGTCATRRVADAAALGQTPYAWRFRVGPGTIEFDDGYRGRQCLDPARAGGDFVVWKSSVTPAYQLAVVIDDAAQQITEVVRGDDLVSSTPRQLLLYKALGLTPPCFVHVPLVIGPDGRRLAKRHGDTRISTLRKAGVRPEALAGFLAWSCGWLDRIEPAAPEDLISRFRLDMIPKDPFVLRPELLARIGYSGAG